MTEFKHKLAFVVPTKDRPSELHRLLGSLRSQSSLPDEIIIVDGGRTPVHDVAGEFSGLPLRYLRCLPPSATRQRNLGIEAVRPEYSLVGILDDDSVLDRSACEAMMAFWEQASEDVGGASFNIVNQPPLFASGLKHLPLAEKLGLYSRKKGAVLSSGFQVMMNGFTETSFVQWISSCGSVWRRKIFEEFRFDEWYDGYSYLEDLDFSYSVGKKYKLVAVASARQHHYPSPRGRIDGFKFGQREVANRLHFVRKHKELSPAKCYLALMTRAGLSLFQAIRERDAYYLDRTAGNISALAKSIG